MEFKNYTEKDYEAVCDFLIKLNQNNTSYMNWNWGRFEWMYEHPEFDKQSAGSIGLWMDEGKIVGAAIYDMYFGEGFCGALPGYDELYSEILDYAVRKLSDESGFGLAICDDNTAVLEVARGMGFELAEQTETIMEMDLEGRFETDHEPDLSAEPLLGKAAAPSLDEVAGRSLGEMADQSLEKTAELSLEETADSSLDETAAPSLDEVAGRSLGEMADQSLEKTAELSLEKTVDRSLEEIAEPSLEETADPSMDETANHAHKLPEDLSYYSPDPKEDAYKVQWLFWQGFDHGEDRAEFEEKEEIVPQRRRHFNKDLNVAAVTADGEFVSYCCLWYDKRTDYAYVEPVCTIPAYRGKGVAKAVIYTALGRAAKMGAKKAYVLSDMKFYEKLGFHKKSHYSFYFNMSRQEKENS